MIYPTLRIQAQLLGWSFLWIKCCPFHHGKSLHLLYCFIASNCFSMNTFVICPLRITYTILKDPNIALREREIDSEEDWEREIERQNPSISTYLTQCLYFLSLKFLPFNTFAIVNQKLHYMANELFESLNTNMNTNIILILTQA